jgi:hypothetical protein
MTPLFFHCCSSSSLSTKTLLIYAAVTVAVAVAVAAAAAADWLVLILLPSSLFFSYIFFSHTGFLSSSILLRPSSSLRREGGWEGGREA